MDFRVGLGQDSHRLKIKKKNEKRKKNLTLGGIEVNQKYYALADSEGDVIIHSLCNALSTAIGGGSLDTWAGLMAKDGITDSKEFLKVILKRVKRKGWQINNVAIMVEAGQPRLELNREKIQASLANLLGIEKDCLGLAFTTGEDLTSFGKGEGIQVFSMVLLQK